MSIQHIPKIFSLTLLDRGADLLHCMFAERLRLLYYPHSMNDSYWFLYCIHSFFFFFLWKYIIHCPHVYTVLTCLPKSGSILRKVGKFPLAGCWLFGFPRTVRDPGRGPICYAQILGEPKSPLCFPSRPLLCRSRKCCLCHLSQRCQAGRMNNKTSKWSAFFKIQIAMTKKM